MFRWLSTIFVLVFIVQSSLMGQTILFNEYFENATMRVDYYHVGNAYEEFITLDHIYKQGIWAGSQKNLLDTFNNGRYYVKVYDEKSGRLIFSKGFNTYFGEYKTSDPALAGIKRTYHESALIPYPTQKIRFTIEKRNRQNELEPLFSLTIDPEDISIIKENLDTDVSVFEIVKNGPADQKVDLAFIAEGYTVEEKEKFESDLKKFSKVFFNQEPFKSYQESFNIYGVFKPSEESGCDEPRHGSFKNTVISTTFNSLGSARYLLTEDNKNLRDIAAHVPYDALIIMINHQRYGGGGIYNQFCTFTTDNRWSEYLLLHEFGHSFAGLADEYYTSSVAYSDFYPSGVEPTEPNITALLNPPHVKWEKFLTTGIEIPTPWNKEKFDKMDLAYQKKRRELNDLIATLKKEHASEEKIKQAEEKAARLSKEHAQKMDNFLKNSKYAGKVGVFEGAGYTSKGLYRPMLDCIMFSKGTKPYCKVCENAIINIIKYYTGVD